MKFIVSKKLIDNRSLYLSVLWMVLFLIIALALNVMAKAIDFGTTAAQWISHILGDETQFIEPLTLQEIMLSLHTELFGLVLVFILIAALLMRTSRSKTYKTVFLIFGVSSLLLYPLGLIASPAIGSFTIILSWSAFAGFHLLMMTSALDIVMLLLRKKF